jgi:hypothetical protein
MAKVIESHGKAPEQYGDWIWALMIHGTSSDTGTFPLSMSEAWPTSLR